MPFFQCKPKSAFNTPRRYLGDRTTTIFIEKRLLPRILASLLPVYAAGGVMCVSALSVFFQLPFPQVLDLLPQSDVAGMATGYDTPFLKGGKY